MTRKIIGRWIGGHKEFLEGGLRRRILEEEKF
jgi:hypothetical protein